MTETYKADSVLQLGSLKYITDQLNERIDNMVDESALRSVALEGNAFNFYTTTNTALTPAYTFDLPIEKYLDTVKTKIVNNFSWNAATYPGSADPNLAGKTVIVFAVESVSNDGLTTTTNYSFMDASNLLSDLKNYIRTIREDANGVSFIDGNGAAVYRLEKM